MPATSSAPQLPASAIGARAPPPGQAWSAGQCATQLGPSQTLKPRASLASQAAASAANSAWRRTTSRASALRGMVFQRRGRRVLGLEHLEGAVEPRQLKDN